MHLIQVKECSMSSTTEHSHGFVYCNRQQGTFTGCPLLEDAAMQTIQARYASMVLILLDQFALTSSVSNLMLSWLTLMLLALTEGSPKQYATVPLMTGALGALHAAAGVVGTMIQTLLLTQQHSQK